MTTEIEETCTFLEKAARYFESRPAVGEDAAHWANIQNAANCRKAKALIEELSQRPERETSPEISALAAKMMQDPDPDVRRLAASVLSQDETKGNEEVS